MFSGCLKSSTQTGAYNYILRIGIKTIFLKDENESICTVSLSPTDLRITDM